jgi:SAM-dependent methyltransferase
LAPDYQQVNRSAWAFLSAQGSDSSRPYQPEDLPDAAARFRSESFVPWDEVRRVLVLGGGGGQQGPLLAWMGYAVTVADLSPDQLRLDADLAVALGLEIELAELDMVDLTPLHDRGFDLVHQPVSACYIPDVIPLYQQVWRVLRPGGWYDVEHWNPVHVQLRGYGSWVEDSYLIERPQQSGVPVTWHPAAAAEPAAVCWHYIHPVDQLVGGLCRTGFRVARLAERTRGDRYAAPGSHEHLAAHVPPFFRLLARRLPDRDAA